MMNLPKRLAQSVRPTAPFWSSARRVRCLSSTPVVCHQSPQSTTGATTDELAHFAELADSWWDVEGPQRILHKMNLLRMDFIQRMLKANWTTMPNSNFVATEPKPGQFVPGYSLDLLPSQKLKADASKLINAHSEELSRKAQFEVLDVGCGGGIVAECLARQSFTKRVRGIDLSPDVLAFAEKHRKGDPALAKKLDYRLIELGQLKEKSEKYDMITMFELLEHVPYPSEVLNEALDLLKPGGLMFLSTINRTPVSYFTTIFMGEDVLKVVPKGTHTLSKYINESEMREWFDNRTDSDVLSSEGCLYIPAYGWTSAGPVSMGNYLMAVRKRL